MIKQNLNCLLFLLLLFSSCLKEASDIQFKENYAKNSIQYFSNSKYPSQDKIALLWWDATSEKIGLFNTVTDSLVVVGTVGDLQWWLQQCLVKEDILYTFGFNENDDSNNMLYKNDIETGKLISKTKIDSNLINLTIAGRYNNEIILLWWDGTSQKFGRMDTNTDSVSTIGVVGDLHWWQNLCFINDNTLYTFGFNENDESYNMLYKNDLVTGNLISKNKYNSNLVNLTISKNK